ncbi:TetR/AcrR family transcriptional regulator [Xinfangfangia sp. D13-10-4-6]|uniref:TetR/AcrR family transcriptional regulator n=1 Tax=Pseudogemmobacter hezensis TaxID=2737662 RepID=UPI0015520503|nr:TetR/AcrR family transcriptional regulator [Pseudogemmobacter hezensis]NPD14923.1 TetR/AcrR family transcriptional regulator [Pseudogemmobacter hezensis]
MARLSSPTRDRILDAAGKLFYAEGLRAVSMDGIAEAVGVTKRTLYYHFRSKDDLIAAWLQMRDQPNLAVFQHWFARSEGDVADKVQAIFDQLARAARRRTWKGCGFLRASVELVNLPGHPAIAAARAHKKRVEAWLCSVLREVGDDMIAQTLARQVILLLDGAFAVVLLHRDPEYFEVAGAAAAALIRRGRHEILKEQRRS